MMRAVGEMPEWPNGTDSKSVVLATVPRVQIPISPPLQIKPQKLCFWGFFVFGGHKGSDPFSIQMNGGMSASSFLREPFGDAGLNEQQKCLVSD
jgi:hypothetical protein